MPGRARQFLPCCRARQTKDGRPFGQHHCDLPELDWGKSEARLDPAVVERMGLKRAKKLGEVGARGGGTDSTPRIHTPAKFRELLLSIARTAKPERLAA